MGHRISFTIDDSVWQELRTIPQRERSRLINEAVAWELRRRGRGRAVATMDRLRKISLGKTASAGEFVRADRDSHW